MLVKYSNVSKRQVSNCLTDNPKSLSFNYFVYSAYSIGGLPPMPKHYTTVNGLFGSKIHYDENGNYAGEPRPGLFEGSMEHYDANGQYARYSDPGLFADHVHHNANGQYVGETWSGLTDEHKIHYDTKGYAGDSWDTLLGTDTELFDSDLTDPGDNPF